VAHLAENSIISIDHPFMPFEMIRKYFGQELFRYSSRLVIFDVPHTS